MYYWTNWTFVNFTMGAFDTWNVNVMAYIDKASVDDDDIVGKKNNNKKKIMLGILQILLFIIDVLVGW